MFFFLPFFWDLQWVGGVWVVPCIGLRMLVIWRASTVVSNTISFGDLIFGNKLVHSKCHSAWQRHETSNIFSRVQGIHVSDCFQDMPRYLIKISHQDIPLSRLATCPTWTDHEFGFTPCEIPSWPRMSKNLGAARPGAADWNVPGWCWRFTGNFLDVF